MKTVVKYGQEGAKVEMREVPIPAIGPGDVLLDRHVRVERAKDIRRVDANGAHPLRTPRRRC